MSKFKLRNLKIREGSLVDKGANPEAAVMLFKRDVDKAEWSTAFINDLPDSSFAHISPGGEKDDDGKTTPRSLRHLPYRDASGKVDPAHVRNALARLTQTDMPEADMGKVRDKLRAALESLSKADSGTPAAKGGDDMKAEDTGAEPDNVDKADQSTEDTDTGKEGDGMEELAKAQERIAELEAQIAESAAPEDIEKAEMPENIRKAFEDMKSELAEAQAIAKAEREQRVAKEFEAKAEQFAYAGAKDDIAKMLRMAHEVSAEYGELVEKTIATANERIEKGGLFTEVGRTGTGDESDSATKLDNLIKAKAKEEGVSIEKATVMVIDTDEGKALYNERSVG